MLKLPIPTYRPRSSYGIAARNQGTVQDAPASTFQPKDVVHSYPRLFDVDPPESLMVLDEIEPSRPVAKGTPKVMLDPASYARVDLFKRN